MPDAGRISRVSLVAALLLAANVNAADVGADPMRPDSLRTVARVQAIVYRVNAIIVSDERRIAIVNGERVGIGDSINRATIVAIGKGEVVIETDGVRQSLRVNTGAGR